MTVPCVETLRTQLRAIEALFTDQSQCVGLFPWALGKIPGVRIRAEVRVTSQGLCLTHIVRGRYRVPLQEQSFEELTAVVHALPQLRKQYAARAALLTHLAEVGTRG